MDCVGDALCPTHMLVVGGRGQYRRQLQRRGVVLRHHDLLRLRLQVLRRRLQCIFVAFAQVLAGYRLQNSSFVLLPLNKLLEA